MVKMRLKSRGIIPHGGGFDVVDPLSGMRFTATTFEQLVAKVTAARRANGLPIGLDFDQEIEQWACVAHPDETIAYDPDMPRKKRLTLNDVVRGTQVMLRFKAGGSKLVDQTEANRRAEICSRCPLNSSFAKPCSGICQELLNLVVGIVGSHQTPSDDRLFSCQICSCFLRAAVWLELKDQCVGVTDEMKKQFKVMESVSGCWKTCPD